MILDKLLQFDPSGTAITVTAVSTNVLDMLNARDMSVGEWPDMVARVTVIAALVAAGAATLTIALQGSIDNATFTDYVLTAAIPKANLGAGTVIDVPFAAKPPQAAGIPRYYRLNYTVATGPFTGGTVEADLVVSGSQSNNPPTYPAGITVAN